MEFLEQAIAVAREFGLEPALSPGSVLLLGDEAEQSSKATEILGGMSGARIARLRCVDGREVAVRKWPDGTDPSRVAALHRIVVRLRRSGFECLAAPISMGASRSTVLFGQRAAAGAVWHVEEWRPGQADFAERSTLERAEVVGRLLGRIHVALATTTETHPAFALRRGCPPSIAERLALVRSWRGRAGGSLSSDDFRLSAAFREAVRHLADLEVRLRRVAESYDCELPICLRDLWHDSLLWTDHEITGVIDLGAARADHPVGDVARLFGSLFATRADLWNGGLAAYEQIRLLREREHELLRLYVDSETVLSTLNWVERLSHGGIPDHLVAAAWGRFDHFSARLAAFRSNP